MPSAGRNRSGGCEMADGWFKTWPERSYDRIDGATPPGSPMHRTPVPLSSLLSHMSLAYSPITKGLHIVPTSDLSPTADNSPGEPRSVPKINVVSEETGRELVLQTCLGGSDVDSRLGNNEFWTSKIGYETGNKFGACKEAKSSDEPDCTALQVEADENGQEQVVIADDVALTRTGASSFSSIVSSLSSDVTPFPADETPSRLEDDDVRSQISFECGEQSKFFASESSESPKLAKKKGITGFFSKSLFNWKGGGMVHSPPSWRFLGKTLILNPDTSQNNRSPNSSIRGSSQSINDSGSQRYGDVVASSSALILHERPASLPAKSEDERVKHHQQYQDIVDAAKRKEEMDSKLRKKTLQRQLKQEEQLSNAVRTWNEEILPKWSERRTQKKTLELWWDGLPPSVRGRVWRQAVDNDLNITPQLYHICATRAEERLNCGVSQSPDCKDCGDGCDNESSMQLIQLDIARTFPQLCIFQKGGPYYDILHSVLGAYVCYRPDVGYVQGMSFLAAILILNMDPPDAFICFANLLNKPCLHAFFTLSHTTVECYYAAYNDLLKENLPRLWSHMLQSGLTPDLYLLDWVYSVFGKAVCLDVACRIWDLFLRDGESFIFRTALGILHLYEKELLQLDFVHGAQLLTRLPDSLSVPQLFKSIASIRMSIGKLDFSQILSSHLHR